MYNIYFTSLSKFDKNILEALFAKSHINYKLIKLEEDAEIAPNNVVLIANHTSTPGKAVKMLKNKYDGEFIQIDTPSKIMNNDEKTNELFKLLEKMYMKQEARIVDNLAINNSKLIKFVEEMMVDDSLTFVIELENGDTIRVTNENDDSENSINFKELFSLYTINKIFKPRNVTLIEDIL